MEEDFLKIDLNKLNFFLYQMKFSIKKLPQKPYKPN